MIRRAKPGDAPAIWDLFLRSLKYDCDLDVVRGRLEDLWEDPHYVILVWEDERGQVLGFLQAQRYDTLHNRNGWNVISLAVLPEAQGTGIGRALLSHFEKGVAWEDGGFVRLNSRVERTEAHGFYEHVGYRCTKTQKYFVKRSDS